MKTALKCCDSTIQVTQELIDVWDEKFFKMLGEPVRMEILKYLMLHGRSDIGSISESLPQDRSVISRHLQLMLDNGVLNWEKETRHRYYSISGPELIKKMELLMDSLRKCISVCCP